MRAVGRRGRMGAFRSRAPCKRLCGAVQARQRVLCVHRHSLKLYVLPAHALHAAGYLRIHGWPEQGIEENLPLQLPRLAM